MFELIEAHFEALEVTFLAPSFLVPGSHLPIRTDGQVRPAWPEEATKFKSEGFNFGQKSGTP